MLSYVELDTGEMKLAYLFAAVLPTTSYPLVLSKAV